MVVAAGEGQVGREGRLIAWKVCHHPSSTLEDRVELVVGVVSQGLW